MEPNNESQYQAWLEDVEFLAKTLAELFESNQYRFNLDETHNKLFVQLEGLEQYSDEEIIEIAEPLLSELDLDFEDVVLVPLTRT